MIPSLLLEDLRRRPDLFLWNGPISTSAIRKWEQEQSLCVPAPLVGLWTTQGGGDLFETETVLQPVGSQDSNLIEPVSRVYWSRGMNPEYYVFHTGVWCSMFRKMDGVMFCSKSPDFSRMVRLDDLNEWYGLLRAEYAERYLLSGP